MFKHQVLSLYRSLLKNANNLSYSDSSYLKQRIRQEFQLNSTLSDKELIQRCIQVILFINFKRGNIFVKNSGLL